MNAQSALPNDLLLTTCTMPHVLLLLSSIEEDNIEDVDTKIVPMETFENGVDIDENNNGIDDIDEEEELLLDYEEDDMSEVEAKQHRFKVEKNQEEIPLPRKFSSIKRKERRRQHHNKRYKQQRNRNQMKYFY